MFVLCLGVHVIGLIILRVTFICFTDYIYVTFFFRVARSHMIWLCTTFCELLSCVVVDRRTLALVRYFSCVALCLGVILSYIIILGVSCGLTDGFKCTFLMISIVLYVSSR